MFESDLWNTINEDIASQSRKILQTFIWWRAQTCPQHTVKPGQYGHRGDMP